MPDHTVHCEDPVVVALVQMACGADKEQNVSRAIDQIGQAASRVRTSSACRSSSRPRIRARTRTTRGSVSRNPFRVPRMTGCGRRRRGTRSSSSDRYSNAARPGCTTTRPWSSTPTADPLGMYRKMHIPDDPLYYEKFYFTPGDLGFRMLHHAATAVWASASAGTSGFPKRLD